ncbi:AhpC/TSA family protein [Lacibacter cauensis]|uniref:AhpC/TSA family protein n=1 Tax=Lacibacter cauensis TaxID=510947 RepID=A0A562SR23_9BACT|nr:TlpA disulfide reductase family protein [Lacibacter cauensis]TWI83256.1 AhpC/TSA family protein [Lacibacter cauensis]
MKGIFFAMCVLFAYVNSTAQTIKPLGIGDTVPDVRLHLLEANGLKTVKLADYYREKPLILDFWASWCAACIKGMTKADSLLQRTGAAVNVLPITYEDEATVRRFIGRQKSMQGLRLPFAVSDDVLMGKLFAFRTLPHAVWIGTDGVVQAITYAEEMNAVNLTAFADNRLPVLREKKDNVDYNPQNPLPVEEGSYVYRSVLTKYQPGLQSIIGAYTSAYSKGAVYKRFIGINTPVVSYYYYCYSKGRSGSVQMQRIELSVKDSMAVNPYRAEDATRVMIEPYLYCFELTLPEKVTAADFFPWLLNDLNRCLPYKGSIEKRERLCWVVKAVDATKHPTASKGTEGIKWKKGIVQAFINQPMEVVCDYFNWNLEYPVVNETGIGYNVDLDVTIKEGSGKESRFLNAASVKESLERYGFTLSLERRLVDILVIRDR